MHYCNYLLFCLFGIFTCFLADSVAHEAITYGRPVYQRDVPYQVSVQIDGHGHICGGSIIGDKFVLTAAHCVLNHTRQLRSRYMSILTGTNNLNRVSPPAVLIKVEKVFFPAEFHPAVDFSFGDIAVLRLTETFHQTYLRRLYFPRNIDTGRTAHIAGFGWHSYRIVGNRRVGISDGQLRQAEADILSYDQCESTFPPGAIQSEVHLCARLRTNDLFTSGSTCTGDDGGSLVENGQIVIGVLSRIPPNCDVPHTPAVYTRVARYIGMIVHVMHVGRDPSMISLLM